MKNVTPPKDSTAAFFREVDEAMQYEKLEGLWKRYRALIVTGTVAVVAAVAGYQGYGAWKGHQSLALAEQYHAAMTLEGEARTKALAEVTAQSGGGYRALAAFEQARSQPETKEGARAADKAYGLVYNDPSQPQWLRSIARLNAALSLLGREDTLAQEHLNLLAQDPGQGVTPLPTYAPALELLSLLAQRQGDTTTARGYLQRLLALADIPADMKQRAQRRMGELSTLGY